MWNIEIKYKDWKYNFPIRNWRKECLEYGGIWMEDILNSELSDCIITIEKELKEKELDMNHFDYIVLDENKEDVDNLINNNL